MASSYRFAELDLSTSYQIALVSDVSVDAGEPISTDQAEVGLLANAGQVDPVFTWELLEDRHRSRLRLTTMAPTITMARTGTYVP